MLTGRINVEPRATAGKVAPVDDSESTDTVIVQRILAGERDLFRELVRRHKNMVFGCVMRQVGSRQLAEELAQESFFKAYSNLRAFRHEARFSTWLVQIAINTTASYFVSRAYRERQRTTAFDAARHELSDNTSAESHEARARLVRFQSALETLHPRLREVLVLCGLEGHSYQEAAQLFGVPVGTIRSRLNTARLAIRKAMSESPGENES